MDKPIPVLDTYPYYGKRAARARGWRRLFYRGLPIPLHTYFPFRLELSALWVRCSRFWQPWRYRGASDLLLNLGAGGSGRRGWVNVDIASSPGVDCVYDCRKRLPFPDSSARGIFCEHFFEHIDYTEEAPSFLSECRRVLVDGGVLRLVVPDAGRYLAAYVDEGWESLEKLRSMDDSNIDPSFGGQYNTKMEFINMVFRQGCQHRFAYDYETVAFLLKLCGFTEVRQQQFGESWMPELSIDQPRRAPESLYVEARK